MEIAEADKLIKILYLRDKDKVTVTIGDDGDELDHAAYIDAAQSKNIAELADTRPLKNRGLGIALMQKQQML